MLAGYFDGRPVSIAMGAALRSTFLLDVKAELAQSRERLELDEEHSESILGESLAARAYVSGGLVSQRLTIWGDHVASYTVRDKRTDKLLFQVREFPLGAEPKQIVETFRWAQRELSRAEADVFERIEARWLELAGQHAH